MYWCPIIIIPLLLQTLFLNSINAKALVRRRRQQIPVSMYGSSNIGSSAQTGYNFPSNANNYYGAGMNSQASKDYYGNPMVPSNAGNSLTNMGSAYYSHPQQQPGQQQPGQQQPGQQQPGQQQPFGTSGQSAGNPSFGGSSIYSISGLNSPVRDPNTNPGMRDPNNNHPPAGSAGSQMNPPSYPHMGYLPNTYQTLNSKDTFNNMPSNTNANNNPYGFNNNAPQNNNNNPYGGQFGMSGNPNSWQTNNNFNSNPNSGNSWYALREANNLNPNSNSQYSNPTSQLVYNHSYRMTSCYIAVLLSFIVLYYMRV